jgi:hypothetical protein
MLHCVVTCIEAENRILGRTESGERRRRADGRKIRGKRGYKRGMGSKKDGAGRKRPRNESLDDISGELTSGGGRRPGGGRGPVAGRSASGGGGGGTGRETEGTGVASYRATRLVRGGRGFSFGAVDVRYASAAADGGDEHIQARHSRDRGSGEGGGGNRNKQRSLPRNY